MKMDEILIVDYGSQYTRLLARRIREIGVYSRVESPKNPTLNENTKGIILSGGPLSVYSPSALGLPKNIKDSSLPMLGICYGMQLLVHELGGEVRKGETFEYGLTRVNFSSDPLFSGVKSPNTWMSHGDSVEKLPPNFVKIAESEMGVIAGIRSKDGKVYGLQFHPEVSQTIDGMEMIKNFVLGLCKAKPTWKMEDYALSKIEEIKEKVGNSKVIAAVSGGVDSTVATVLTAKAVGKNLKCVFVNHGLLRKEDEEVPNILLQLGIEVKVVDASKRFFEELKGVTEPEKKRKIIGETFIRVFEKEARKIDAGFLLQGTIYSDVIESAAASDTSSKIKSHHNVGGLPKDMNLKLVEPLRELFKDEVRELGKVLQIPERILNRHPFPGPGLAIRIIGEVDPERAEILKKVDEIYTSILKESGEYDKIWQAFSVLLPIRSVGVKGDQRAYGYVVALRAVDSFEGMTASWHEMPNTLLRKISSTITDKVPSVGRVVYDVSDKPPATIEWE